MLFGKKKKNFTAREMIEMENKLRESELYKLGLKADTPDLAERLGLKVEYVDDMHGENEAELLPIDDSNYNGLIKLNRKLEKKRFAYIHEVIHYIFDVGYGNKVTENFTRKVKGKTENDAEQVVNYITASYIMPYDSVAEELTKYDNSQPKMDVDELILSMQDNYDQDEEAIFRRIKEVRTIDKYS